MEQAYRTQTLKALHYLALRKPIVSITLNDWMFLKGKLVFMADNHEQFIYHIKNLIDGHTVPIPTAAIEYLQKVRYPQLIESILDKLKES